MKENDTRDNAMKEELNREECDNEEVRQFLMLLKRPKGLMPDNKNEIQLNEWKQVVRRATKRVTSPMFSMRDYFVYKCALESDRVVTVLVKVHNIFINCDHCPSRWLKVVYVMLEKVKGPRLKN